MLIYFNEKKVELESGLAVNKGIITLPGMRQLMNHHHDQTLETSFPSLPYNQPHQCHHARLRRFSG
jgi:hypothetical protein